MAEEASRKCVGELSTQLCRCVEHGCNANRRGTGYHRAAAVIHAVADDDEIGSVKTEAGGAPLGIPARSRCERPTLRVALLADKEKGERRTRISREIELRSMRGLCERLLLKIMSMMMPLDGGCLRRLVDRCSTTGGSTAFLSPILIFLPFSFVSVASQTAPCLIQRASRRTRFALGRRSMAGWLTA
eukprot:COSAG06_NODE_2867_length_6151_cov_28.736781_4_plen_187_part_00